MFCSDVRGEVSKDAVVALEALLGLRCEFGKCGWEDILYEKDPEHFGNCKAFVQLNLVPWWEGEVV